MEVDWSVLMALAPDDPRYGRMLRGVVMRVLELARDEGYVSPKMAHRRLGFWKQWWGGFLAGLCSAGLLKLSPFARRSRIYVLTDKGREKLRELEEETDEY